MDWSPGYREWAADPDVAAAVACTWVSVIARERAESTLVVPDGCVDLIWQRGRGAFVAGPDTGPAPTSLPCGTILVGVRFRPGAGGAALGVPLASLRDLRVEVSDVNPALARSLPADLSPEEAVITVGRVTAHVVTSSPPDTVVAEAARLLTDPRTRTDDLVAALGVSERQLRRRFDTAVGYGPKTLQRVLRFRRFLAHLRGGGMHVGLAEIAVRFGYADQAHLTRESTRLAGMAPTALARALGVIQG
jgi:AraC-like DNA-binding protein